MNLHFTIPLCPVTKKNSEVKTRDGRILSSKAYRQYEKDAVRVIPPFARKRIDFAVNVEAVYYTKIDYANAKSRIDLSNLHNALCDVLVAAGVIADDNCRIIASMDGSRVRCDKKRPRTEVTITEAES